MTSPEFGICVTKGRPEHFFGQHALPLPVIAQAADEFAPAYPVAIALIEIGMRHGYYQNANGSEDAITMACELMGKSNG